jgi:hypothetical protein
MKKHKITMMAIFAVLFSCLFLMGCPPDDNTDNTVNLAGKVIILQAYGNAGDGSPAGVSHSFVELYNITDEAISLNGISLYYADGTTVPSGINTATEDGAWARISLTGTIPAKGSFLILGAEHSDLSGTRYKIADDYGDINSDNLSLSRRSFKVALIKGTADLTLQNPFIANGGDPVSGYIDMVGAANSYQSRDLIFGFETAPARNSASEAVRRWDHENYLDTDNNSTDFIAARYASDGMSDEELEVRRPRNSSAGEWNPFETSGEPLPPENPTVAGTPSALAGQLLILQVYGTGTDTDGAVSHSFIELYNNTESAVNLNTYSLQYANTTGTNWTVINLTGTIPAKSSYLVRGSNNNTSGRLQLDAADQNAEFFLDNRNFKVALMANQNKLTVENPFAMTGGKAEGYVDMVGVKNGNSDNIDGFEAALAQVISKQAAARRGSLTDTDNNSTDFERIDYRTSGTTNEQAAQYKPRTSSDGEWEPFEEPEPPVIIPTGNTLLILQANTYGNNSNGGFSKSLVELYNNSDTEVNLDGYYLHIGNNNSWTYQISLAGKTIPAGKSFLIVSDSENVADTSADLPAEDLSAAFVIANDNFKIAIMRNNRSTLSVANPFGDESLAADYVDMLGVGATTDGYETARATGQSRPRPVRRTSLTDSDNNSVDFAALDYRPNQANRITTPDFYKYWPRSSTMEAWDPITGLPEVQPQNIHSRHNAP